MRRSGRFWLMVIAMSVIAADGGASEILYDQLEADVLRGAFADGVPGQIWNQRVADDFTLTDAAILDGVWFAGGDENFMTSELDNVSSFVVVLYEDDGGLPGTALYTEEVPLEEVTLEYLGLNQLGGETYEFHLDFAGVPVGPGTYWCSVGAVQIDPGGEGLLWNFTADIFNNLSATERPFGTGYLQTPFDYSMAILGSRACVGDVDGDGAVGFGDILAVLGAWGPCGDCPEDVDGDGVVGFSEILTILGAWGDC